MLDISALPSIPLHQRKELPVIPAIYLVVDDTGTVDYIGQTTNLRTRIMSHNKLKAFLYRLKSTLDSANIYFRVG